MCVSVCVCGCVFVYVCVCVFLCVCVGGVGGFDDGVGAAGGGEEESLGGKSGDQVGRFGFGSKARKWVLWGHGTAIMVEVLD